MAAAAFGCTSASGSWGLFVRDNLSRKSLRNQNMKNGFRVSCISSAHVFDSYKTLKIQPGASESEVKKAFRQLALQYHPDVCRGSNCGIDFHQINEAYDVVMRNLRGETSASQMETYGDYEEDEEEEMRGINDEDWELWEEWMGWEGAGIRDYSSHINPYI